MLGTFVLNLEEINGFSRICPGDEYEVTIRYGQQKMKTRGRILKHDKNQQNWTRQIFHLKAKLADVLLIKISEVKLLGVSLKTLGTKCFEVNNFYSIEPQRMIVNANQSGTIKLSFLVHWEFVDRYLSEIVCISSFSRRLLLVFTIKSIRNFHFTIQIERIPM